MSHCVWALKVFRASVYCSSFSAEIQLSCRLWRSKFNSPLVCMRFFNISEWWKPGLYWEMPTRFRSRRMLWMFGGDYLILILVHHTMFEKKLHECVWLGEGERVDSHSWWCLLYLVLVKRVCLMPVSNINCFYDNCRKSRMLIGSFSSSISGQTHELIIYAMWQRARADHLTIYHKSILMSVFNASVLVLTTNFVIMLS